MSHTARNIEGAFVVERYPGFLSNPTQRKQVWRIFRGSGVWVAVRMVRAAKAGEKVHPRIGAALVRESADATL